MGDEHRSGPARLVKISHVSGTEHMRNDLNRHHRTVPWHLSVMRTPVALPPSLRNGAAPCNAVSNTSCPSRIALLKWRDAFAKRPNGCRMAWSSKCSCGRRVRLRPPHTWTSGFRRRDYNLLHRTGSRHEQFALPRVCPDAVHRSHRNRYYRAVQIGPRWAHPLTPTTADTTGRTVCTLQGYLAVLAGEGTHGAPRMNAALDATDS
jgi:hypothetical protein